MVGWWWTKNEEIVGLLWIVQITSSYSLSQSHQIGDGEKTFVATWKINDQWDVTEMLLRPLHVEIGEMR